MRVLFVESPRCRRFSPIALLRPVFELLCGTRSMRQRVLDTLQPDEWGVVVRPSLAAVYAEEFPEARVNDLEWINAGATVLVDGTWLGDPRELAAAASTDTSFVRQFEPKTAAFESLEQISELFSADSSAEGRGHVLRYPWELINHNGEMITLDFELLKSQRAAGQEIPPGSLSSGSSADQVFIHPTASIEPFVAINAEAGPVIVDEGAVIQSFTRLEGPCYIGRETQLFRANVRGETSFGPVCRVGGEIEASIIHGYANKYHDGFLGHSYVCPWVNLGALTSNSDLKNDYSTVKFPLGTEYIATGEKKIGCLIGDHAKTAIGTLFNTGSNVGVMSMVLPAGRLCPKHIPSFTRLWHGALDDQLDLEAALNTAATAMGRRKHELTAAQRELLTTLREETSEERTAAINR
ncbi:putative sugar nucleotidyl transferase [Rubinisphaera margarita]|uniref:putative sugar nucleotidyl transferase n=1 Tax=Rubinisphaera margarita TaxID=2909586 RepID=UPI001EE7FE10|nr:putative sugar nucleotidyl transferase [Rubinisphaera margarita]MCG6155075.1 hypothetical protein [Rubinisphaera margarita]